MDLKDPRMGAIERDGARHACFAPSGMRDSFKVL